MKGRDDATVAVESVRCEASLDVPDFDNAISATSGQKSRGRIDGCDNDGSGMRLESSEQSGVYAVVGSGRCR